uniref:Retrotransposon gag domain-containing protein n=1 Tax=Brassica oleracea var. oleracea TaxID=109376 RepID=A0A0D3BDP8_BRAOL
MNIVEEILEFRQVPDDVRVPLIATRFQGRAMACFLPFNYERTLYNKLQNLRQGTRSVDEYATEFFYMTARMPSAENQQQLIARFIGGLRSQLQVALAQFNPPSVSEAHKRAISMEQQLCSSWTSSSRTRFQQGDTSSQQGTTLQNTEATKTPANNDTIANSRPARTNALRCYTCGERL